MKISALTTNTALALDDEVPHHDKSAGTTKKFTIPALLSMVYPVGSIYANETDSTSPATLFGFGTWVRLKGRVLVGLDEADTDFDTAGETGGEKTHILTLVEMASHAHGVNDPGHNHNPFSAGLGFGAGGLGAGWGRADANNPAQAWSNGAMPTRGTGISIQSAGGGGAHNNLQPYRTVYMWKRTA